MQEGETTQAMESLVPITAEPDVVVVERRGHTIWATLNRPEAANALKPPATFEAFERLFDIIRRDESIKALVITGAGDHAFCVGSDLPFLEEAFRTRNFHSFRDYLQQINAWEAAQVRFLL